MKRFLLTLTIILLCLSGLWGSGTQEKPGQPTPQVTAPVTTALPSASPSPAPRTAVPLVVRDALNREVTIPEKVERIIPMDFSQAENLCLVGARDKIVALGRTRPNSGILQRYLPQQSSLPIVGTNAAVSVEKTLAAQPDLFICNAVPEAVNLLEKAGVRVYVTNFGPDVFDSINQLTAIGQVARKVAEAGKVTAFLKNLIQTVSSRAEGIPSDRRPRVYYARNDITETVGANAQSQVIELCGGRNVTRELGEPSQLQLIVSIEKIYQWDPDVIVIRSKSPYTPEAIYKDDRLKDLKAVKTKRVYQGFYANSETGMELGFGMIEKLKWLQPDKAADLDADKAYKEFFALVDSLY